MNPSLVAERLGRGSDVCAAYREAVLARLEGVSGDADDADADDDLHRAMAEWAELVPGRPGTGSGDRRDAFATACYHDYLVCRLLARVERDLGVRLANPEPGANSGALSVAPGDRHRGIAADAGLPAPDDPTGDDPVGDALPTVADLRDGGVALLGAIAASTTARGDRRARGAFYTPRGVADLAIEAADADPATDTVLDPACGAGVFLVAAVERKLGVLESRDPDAVVDAVTNTVVGVDLDPVAVRAARLAYLLALAPALDPSDPDPAGSESVAVPVFCTDALGLTRDDALRFRGESVDLDCDALVGNPPWLTWSDLPEDARRAWRERFSHLDLAPASGAAARLGHANDDLAVPFAWVCVHRYLRDGGRVGLVLKRGLTKGPAGRAFRRLRVGDRRLSVARVHDLGAVDPFDADADAAVYALAEEDADDGAATFPVPTTVWAADGERVAFDSLAALRETATTSATALAPVDPADPASAWVRGDAERAALGECAHAIRHGVKDDAAAVFGVERETLADRDLEPDFVFPYLKSRHVRRWGISGHDLRIVPQRKAGADNEADLRARAPRTYAYLDDHRERLESRASSWLDAGPFYGVFGLGAYTWKPYKLVWCRLGFRPEFAVVSTVDDPDLGEQPVVPGDHYMFLATENRREAHLCCALCNSAPYRRTLRDVAGDGKSSLSKSVVSRLRLPEWPRTDRAGRLADCSIRAHEVVAEADDSDESDPELAAIEGEVDRLVEAMLAE